MLDLPLHRGLLALAGVALSIGTVARYLHARRRQREGERLAAADARQHANDRMQVRWYALGTGWFVGVVLALVFDLPLPWLEVWVYVGLSLGLLLMLSGFIAGLREGWRGE